MDLHGAPTVGAWEPGFHRKKKLPEKNGGKRRKYGKTPRKTDKNTETKREKTPETKETAPETRGKNINNTEDYTTVVGFRALNKGHFSGHGVSEGTPFSHFPSGWQLTKGKGELVVCHESGNQSPKSD